MGPDEKKVVSKFMLCMAEFTKILMPQDATILSVGMRGARICLWAEVVANRLAVETEERIFAMVKNGMEVFPEWTYLGTIPEMGRGEVHIYETKIGNTRTMKRRDQFSAASLPKEVN